MLDLPENVEEVQVDNAPVRQHRHDQWTIEGYSRAAMQTYWRIPELKLGFDLGLQPWSFMTTPTWAVSHAHMDHIAALPVYVARRRLMKMPEPTIYLPLAVVEDVDALLRVFQRLDRGRLPCQLVGVEPGMEIDLSREHVLTVIETFHTVPSVGFVVWDRRRKLKAEFSDLSSHEIRELKFSGVEITQEVRVPLVAYVGDSNPLAFDRNPVLYNAKILITELTFVSPEHRRDKIHRYGHLHLDDFLDRADHFNNELIIASHFSTRYHDQQLVRMVEKKLPPTLQSRMLLWV